MHQIAAIFAVLAAVVNGAELNEEIRARLNLAQAALPVPNESNPPPDTSIVPIPLYFPYPNQQCALINLATLGSLPNPVPDVASVQDCSSFCTGYDGEFCKYGVYMPLTKQCYLLTSCATKTPAAGVTSFRQGTSSECDNQASMVVLNAGAAYPGGENACRTKCKESSNQYCSYFGIQELVAGGVQCIFFSNRATQAFAPTNCGTTGITCNCVAIVDDNAGPLQTFSRMAAYTPGPPNPPNSAGPVCVQYSYHNEDYSKTPNTIYKWPSDNGAFNANIGACQAGCLSFGDCIGFIYNAATSKCGFYNNRSPTASVPCTQRVDLSIFTGAAAERFTQQFGEGAVTSTIVRYRTPQQTFLIDPPTVYT